MATHVIVKQIDFQSKGGYGKSYISAVYVPKFQTLFIGPDDNTHHADITHWLALHDYPDVYQDYTLDFVQYFKNGITLLDGATDPEAELQIKAANPYLQKTAAWYEPTPVQRLR